MKITILFDANPLLHNKSGVGHFTQRLTKSLAELDPENIQLVGHYFNFLGRHKPDLLIAPNIQYTTTRYMPIRGANVLRRLGIFLPVTFFYRKHIDFALFPNYMTMPTAERVKSAVVVHDLAFVDHPEYVSTRNADFLRSIVPKAVREVDLVLSVSEFTKKRIQEAYGIAAEKIHVVVNPPVEKVAPDVRIITQHNLENYLLFVGTIEPRKNILGLLQAYEKLPEKLRVKYSLVLVGSKGWKDEAIIQCLEQLRNQGLNIITTGYVTDAEKAALYEKATLCVLPSHYEGYGMPILEAMSYGTPMLCSNIDASREVGRDAVAYFDKDDLQDFTKTMAKLLENPSARNDLSAKGSAYIAKYPTWPQIAAELYQKLTRLR